MHLLIVQYAGDYRQAFNRFLAGEDETYHAQRESVNAVAEIGKKINEAAILCCLTKESYNEVLKNGVRAIGTGFVNSIQDKKLLKLIEAYHPTHLVLRTPNQAVLRWAVKQDLKTLVILADSFNLKGLRSKVRHYQLARLLNNDRIDWVGNHGVTSSISLANIGVNPDKIIPWDLPHQVTPETFSVKTLPSNKKSWEVFYVGSVAESKGIGDGIEAIAYLINRGLSIKLKIAGKGDVEQFKNKVRHLKIEDSVEFLGLVPNTNIIPLMREADFFLVPSRHEYPEGFPFTIYEALCSRTPIIASDHPMFVRKLSHRNNALIFPANNPVALAECIEELISSPELYQNLSSASYQAWKSLQIPVTWVDLVNRWLFDSSENKQWLLQNTLSSGQYTEL
jgi:glycosyltransferase involved in cell wall biosynthesis